jgi:ATP diphosphatase
VVVNLAQWYGIGAESALRDTNVRFTQRFQQVEQLAKAQNIAITSANATQLLALWDKAKLLLENNA